MCVCLLFISNGTRYILIKCNIFSINLSPSSCTMRTSKWMWSVWASECVCIKKMEFISVCCIISSAFCFWFALLIAVLCTASLTLSITAGRILVKLNETKRTQWIEFRRMVCCRLFSFRISFLANTEKTLFCSAYSFHCFGRNKIRFMRAVDTTTYLYLKQYTNNKIKS